MSKLFSRKRPAVAMRGVHLDLKGLPPKPKRLFEILDLLALLKINCVLVEWEDTYPWTVDKSLRCETAYSEATVKKFLDHADKLGIEVIPLLQSFGHMENVLTKKKYRKLSELPQSVSDLCPSNPKSVGIVAAMIDDIMRLHKGKIRYLHLGGDEVWSLGSCAKCKKFVAENGKAALYMKHITPLLDQASANGVRPILWDDMMREWPMGELKKLAKSADLMPWAYQTDPLKHIEPKVLDKFQKAGIPLWAASAFKGADGEVANVANLEARASNNVIWAKVAAERKFAGMIATGWSRYSTSRAPCEALEASLDALAFCAAAMWDGRLSKDYTKAADKFLSTGKAKALAGQKFFKCREAAQEVERWANYMPQRVKYLCATASMVKSEKARIDPWWAKNRASDLKNHIEWGEKALAEFEKAQKAMVPQLWLKNYSESRIWIEKELLAIASKVFKTASR